MAHQGRTGWAIVAAWPVSSVLSRSFHAAYRVGVGGAGVTESARLLTTGDTHCLRGDGEVHSLRCSCSHQRPHRRPPRTTASTPDESHWGAPEGLRMWHRSWSNAVSYTHLTLP